MDWFLYDRHLRHEKDNDELVEVSLVRIMKNIYEGAIYETAEPFNDQCSRHIETSQISLCEDARLGYLRCKFHNCSYGSI